jgi:hypothetical protein
MEKADATACEQNFLLKVEFPRGGMGAMMNEIERRCERGSQRWRKIDKISQEGEKVSFEFIHERIQRALEAELLRYN